MLVRRFQSKHSTTQAISCSQPACHTAKYMSSIGQDMAKVSTVDAKQKRRCQLQQLWPDSKSSASHNMPDSFLVKELNFATADRRPFIHSKAFLSHHLHGRLDGFSDQTPSIKAWLMRQNHEVGMFPCEDLSAADQSPHSYPVSPSEASASLWPGNTLLKA